MFDAPLNIFVFYGWYYQECNLEEVSEEEEAPPTKSSKDKKANGPDAVKAPSLVFKLTSRVQYKTVLKGTFSFFFSWGTPFV